MPGIRALLTSSLLALHGLTGPPAPVTYEAPVPGPVVDGFRPPASPYGPGNRGLEFATTPGEPVGAAAGGVVTFAGPVAGDRYVTVLHDDRVRTAYGPLRAVSVEAGQVVAPGQVVGRAGPRLLWTARLGRDAYVDPAVLLAASGRARLRLVPVPERSRSGAAPAVPAPPAPAPVPAGAVRWALGGGPVG